MINKNQSFWSKTLSSLFDREVKLLSVHRLKGHHLFLCVHVERTFYCQQSLSFLSGHLHIPQQKPAALMNRVLFTSCGTNAWMLINEMMFMLFILFKLADAVSLWHFISQVKWWEQEKVVQTVKIILLISITFFCQNKLSNFKHYGTSCEIYSPP